MQDSLEKTFGKGPIPITPNEAFQKRIAVRKEINGELVRFIVAF